MASPTKTLPDGYYLRHSIDLTQNRSLVIGLNFFAVIFFILFGYAYLRLLAWMRPLAVPTFGPSSWLVNLLALIIAYAGVVVLHEIIHGLCFWIITGEKPLFGFRGAYAFAAAPDWYLPRGPYFVVALAPFVLITLAGILLIPITPDSWLILLGVAVTGNAAGAIADLAVAAWLLLKNPAGLLVCDHGDEIEVLHPGS